MKIGTRTILEINFYFFKLKFNLPTYSVTPSTHPIKCPPQVPITQLLQTLVHLPLPLPFVHYPGLGVSHVLSPFLIFPTLFFFFTLQSLSLFFILHAGAWCGTESWDSSITLWAKGRYSTTEPPRRPLHPNVWNRKSLWRASHGYKSKREKKKKGCQETYIFPEKNTFLIKPNETWKWIEMDR